MKRGNCYVGNGPGCMGDGWHNLAGTTVQEIIRLFQQVWEMDLEHLAVYVVYPSVDPDQWDPKLIPGEQWNTCVIGEGQHEVHLLPDYTEEEHAQMRAERIAMLMEQRSALWLGSPRTNAEYGL